MAVSAPKPAKLSFDEYLLGESHSEVRHEYVDGDVFAMAGGTRVHNVIALNFAGEIRQSLRGSPCQVFMADVLVRLRAYQQEVSYYPDVVVGCDERDTHAHYLRFPKLIVEVLSKSTERIDRNEKFLRYITIPTLEEFVLVEQSRQEITIFRRRLEWGHEIITDPEALVRLESIGLELPMSVYYDNVVTGPEE